MAFIESIRQALFTDGLSFCFYKVDEYLRSLIFPIELLGYPRETLFECHDFLQGKHF